MVNLESAGDRQKAADRPAADHGASGSLVYLDHAATTPMLPEALAAMAEELAHTGNPSSLHNAGRRARRVVEESREQIAQAFGARPSEVVFTSGGTEADNLAVKGLYWARQAGPGRGGGSWRPRSSTTRCWTAWSGSASTRAPRSTGCQWTARACSAPTCCGAAIERDPGSVALVSVMWANNEVGAIQPVAELAAVAERARHPVPQRCRSGRRAASREPGGQRRDRADDHRAQDRRAGRGRRAAAGQGRWTRSRAAWRRPGARRQVGHPRHRGDQGFRGRRRACRGAQGRARGAGSGRLRDRLIGRVRAAVPDAILNGPAPGEHRLPGNAHFSFPGCEGDALLMLLDAKGIACSTGSACTAGVAQPSHVLLAMGADHARARGSLRFTLGRTSTQADVDALGAAIGEVVERATARGQAGGRAADRPGPRGQTGRRRPAAAWRPGRQWPRTGTDRQRRRDRPARARGHVGRRRLGGRRGPGRGGRP